MSRVALVLILAALASPAAADDHFDEGLRLMPLPHQRSDARRLAEVEAKLARCPDLKPGPQFGTLFRSVIGSFNPPPATQPDVPAIRAWIRADRDLQLARYRAYPPGPDCESLRNHFGRAKIVVDRSGKEAVPACARDGTCPDRVLIDVY